MTITIILCDCTLGFCQNNNILLSAPVCIFRKTTTNHREIATILVFDSKLKNKIVDAEEIMQKKICSENVEIYTKIHVHSFIVNVKSNNIYIVDFCTHLTAQLSDEAFEEHVSFRLFLYLAQRRFICARLFCDRSFSKTIVK